MADDTHISISLEQARDVARLARLALSDAELESLRDDLDAILGYVAQLDELDVSGVEPTTHAVPLTLPMREDTPEPTLTRAQVLANAPKVQDGLFVVPTIVEGGN